MKQGAEYSHCQKFTLKISRIEVISQFWLHGCYQQCMIRFFGTVAISEHTETIVLNFWDGTVRVLVQRQSESLFPGRIPFFLK